MTMDELLRKSQQLQEQLIAWRRDFHQHPETAYEELRTAAAVEQHLRGLGLEVTAGVGRTGVVAVLRGEEPGPTIGLRADMDALPIQDQKTADYASKTPGKAHLCGHDAHTSMLMGAAKLLTEYGKPKRGNIKFIFQPAEEGYAGAKAMMDDGVLDNPKVDVMVGLHVYPGLPTGSIGGNKGVAFASADPIEIEIIGSGGHAARPHEGIDAIAAAAQVVTALQNVTSRMVDPLEPAVVTIGTIHGGDMATAIASSVRMTGTVRTLSPQVRKQMPALIERAVKGASQTLGADYKFRYDASYPPVVNDEKMVDFVMETSEKLFGKPVWTPLKPSTGGEDFAFYSEAVPSVFFRLGVNAGEPRTSYPLHHPMFDLDEQALPHGVALLSSIALTYLQLT